MHYVNLKQAIQKLETDISNRYSKEFVHKTKQKVIEKIEDITRWREDMNYIFEWQNNILLTSAASE